MRKKIIIVYRKKTPEAQKKSSELAFWLEEKGHAVFSSPDQKITSAIPQWPLNQSLNKINLVVVLGGDGTYLQAVRLVNGSKTPILGVNFGSLGFLTETRLDQLYESIELFLKGALEQRPRTMLEITVSQKKEKKTFQALNDLVIERGSRSQLVQFQIKANSQRVCEMKADGIIIASPTGSTAYNISAGGPIVHPEASVFVLTPICPHSLTSRPLIFPDSYTLKIELEKKEQKASLVIDGIVIQELSQNDEVKIKKSKLTHFVLRKPNHNFYYLLRKKLQFTAS